MKNNTVPITTNDAARTALNRANAAHSTGPKTEAGKKRSSLNAYRHGFTGQTIILPAQDLVAYQAFTRTFFDRYKPVDIIEKQLVQSLADTSWRLNRVAALEHNLMGLGFDEHSDQHRHRTSRSPRGLSHHRSDARADPLLGRPQPPHRAPRPLLRKTPEATQGHSIPAPRHRSQPTRRSRRPPP